MTKEEIAQKLAALCMYAPYGLKVKHDLQEFPCELQSIDLYRGSVECLPIGEKAFLGTQHFHVEFVKPILRTMDSMTEEEMKEVTGLSDTFLYADKEDITTDEFIGGGSLVSYKEMSKVVTWLCERKFDFMGLIHDGMAVDEKEMF